MEEILQHPILVKSSIPEAYGTSGGARFSPSTVGSFQGVSCSLLLSGLSSVWWYE